MKAPILIAVSILFFATTAAASPWDNGVERVSVSSSGTQGGFGSDAPAISANGRFVAFESYATNLVAGDTNDLPDVFLHDRQTGATVLVSRSSGGAQSNGGSRYPAVSADGRFIAFSSVGTNLVAGDTNGVEDVFLHDRITGFTTRVSVTTSGAQADGYSTNPAISGDGQFVVFSSSATNLHVLGNGGFTQVYVRDTGASRTTLCSVAAFLVPGNSNSQNPAISADGSRIVFQSSASNLTTVDDPLVVDIFLYERASGLISRVNRGYNGATPDDHSADPAISADGNWVAFRSTASNLIAGGTLGESQVFLQEIAGGNASIVSVHTNGNHGDDFSGSASISSNGKRVAFRSQATNLVPGDTNGLEDLFIHDVATGTTACMTRAPGGQQAGGVDLAFAAGGDFIAFASDVTDYVPGDTNGSSDVFVRDYGVFLRNAGANPSSYRSSRTVLGEEWRAGVDLTTTGHAFAVLYGKAGPANLTLGGGQRLLIGGQAIFKLPARPGPVATWSAPVPLDPSLVGLTLYTQAVHLLGVTPFELSNTQDLCLAY